MIKIVIIGETCIDEFIYCKAERLSPEAPVPVLQPIRTTTNSGMAGNVAENIKALYNNQEINLQTWAQAADIKKVRYVDEKLNHMFVRVDSGETAIIPFSFNTEIEDSLLQADIVIVSDYNKGFLNENQLVHIGKLAKLSILDTKRRLTESAIQSYTFVKLNESEAIQNQHLISNSNIITTLGSRGCMYDNQIYPSPKPQETIDVSGAGDTFTAAFIAKYNETRNIKSSINFANEMASIVVSKRGVTTIL